VSLCIIYENDQTQLHIKADFGKLASRNVVVLGKGLTNVKNGVLVSSDI
jgi:hypothetical protein